MTGKKQLTNQNNKNISLKGKWFITLYGPNGEIKDQKTSYNIITDNGKEFLAAFLASAAASATLFEMHHMAIGDSSGTAYASNTALGNELARTTGTASYSSNAIFGLVATFGTGVGTGGITEYAIFSSSTGGTMLNRDVESVVNKGANDTLSATLELTIG